MQTIGAYEAKTHLARLLDQAAQGETFVVTKHGKPIARIVPFVEDQQRAREAAVEAMRAYRRTAPPLEGITVKDIINEGRRY